MKKIGMGGIAISLALFGLISTSASAQTAAEKAKLKKLGAYIAAVAKEVGGPNQIGVKSTFMNWAENPEVSDVKKFGDAKRVASLWQLIQFQQEKEEKVFPNFKTVQEQMAISLITRFISFSRYQELVGKSDNDVIVKDYLDGEIADLKMVFAGKLSAGMYYQAREQRKNKLEMLLGQDKDFWEEAIKMKVAKDTKIEGLSNKTFVISLMDTCTQNLDACVKLSGK